MAYSTPEGLAVKSHVRRTTRGTFEAGFIDEVNTEAGPNDSQWVSLGPYPAAQVQICNMSGVAIQYSRNKQLNVNWMVIQPGVTQVIEGITQASDIAIRRNDFNGAQVSVSVAYEVYV